jgi:hypothetical protein
VFEVYDCTHLGNNVFEWYQGAVTYENGTPVAATRLNGPFTGPWQPDCPAGDPVQPSNPCPFAQVPPSRLNAHASLRLLPPTDTPPPPPPPDC